MQSNHTKRIALGGVLAATALVIMCLGGFIPIATYVCTMLCCMTQFVVFRYCGKQLAWVWFAVVSVLSVLLGPDKEAALVFLIIGYYPLIKQKLEKTRLSIFLKLLFFNGSMFLIYAFMLSVLGMHEIVEENMELGMAGLALILLLGNATFFLLDRLLTIMAGKLR